MIIKMVMIIIMMKKIGSLDSDKMCVTKNGVLGACNGALWDTIKPPLKIFFLGMNIRWEKNF